MGEMGSDQDFSRRTLSNLITEVAYVVVAAVIGLVMVPFYIGELGMAAYAIVPLATSVTSYVMIIADSFCSSVNRYFVVTLERGSHDEVESVFGTAMFSLLRIVVFVVPIMAILAYLSPLFFDISGSTAMSVRLLFMMVLLSALIVAVGSCFNNALIAKNKLYSINIARISYLLLQIVLIVVMFTVDTPRLEFIGLAYLIASLSYLVLSFILMRVEFPWLNVSLRKRNPSYLKEIDRLSVWSIVNRLGSLLSLQASLIVTNIFLGAYDEGSFSLVVSLVSMISTACLAVTNVFNPFLFRYYASQEMGSMASACVIGIRFLSLVLAMPLAFVCIFSPELLTAWVGEEYVFLEDVIWVMFLVLTMQSSTSVLEVIPTITLDIRGMALITVGFGVLSVMLSVMLCTFTNLGLLGVAIAWAITMGVRSCIAIPVYVASTLGLGWSRFIKPQAVGLVLFLSSSVVLYVLSLVFDMPTNLLLIIPIFLVMFLAYVFLTFRLVFRKENLSGFLDLMPASVAKVVNRFL